MQRGRRSAAASNIISLAATGTGSRLTVPSFLSTGEALMFTELAIANPHLTISDVPMLAAFVQAASKTHKLGRQKDISAFEKAARLMIALARSLRLTPQSTTEPKTVGRKRRDSPGVSYYSMMEDGVE